MAEPAGAPAPAAAAFPQLAAPLKAVVHLRAALMQAVRARAARVRAARTQHPTDPTTAVAVVAPRIEVDRAQSGYSRLADWGSSGTAGAVGYARESRGRAARRVRARDGGVHRVRGRR